MFQVALRAKIDSSTFKLRSSNPCLDLIRFYIFTQPLNIKCIEYFFLLLIHIVWNISTFMIILLKLISERDQFGSSIPCQALLMLMHGNYAIFLAIFSFIKSIYVGDEREKILFSFIDIFLITVIRIFNFLMRV